MNRNQLLALVAITLVITGGLAIVFGWFWQWVTLLLVATVIGWGIHILRGAAGANSGYILIGLAVLALIGIAAWVDDDHPQPAPVQVVTSPPSSIETATGLKEVEKMVVQPGSVVQWVVLRPFCYEHAASDESALVLTDGAGNRLGWTTWRVNPTDRIRRVRNTGTATETVTLIKWARPADGCGR